MNDSLLAQGVQALKVLGLNYAFVLDVSERQAFVRGMFVTVQLALLTIAGSLAAGVALAAALTSGRAWLARPARAFVEVTRNTPTLVQLYCAFLVLNMLITQQLRDWGAGNNPLTPFVWVVIVVSLHKGVFHAEALRAGIEAVPATTLEAARSLGFSQRQLLVRVQLPLAVRFALPSLTNNLVDLVKMTARSEEHTSELQSQSNLVCRLLLEKKKRKLPQPTVSKTCELHETANCIFALRL